jgi:hypothetical protein
MFRFNERIFHESLIAELITLVCLRLCLLATVQPCIVACLEFQKYVCLCCCCAAVFSFIRTGNVYSDLVQYLEDDFQSSEVGASEFD